MPLFLDVHEIAGGVAMDDLAKAHLADHIYRVQGGLVGRRRPMRTTRMARFGSIAAVVKLPDRNNLNRSLTEAKEVVMSRIPRICGWARRLAGLAGALLAASAAAPAALANRAVGSA